MQTFYKMSLCILAIFLFLSGNSVLLAQELAKPNKVSKFYFDIKGGYNFGMNKGYIEGMDTKNDFEAVYGFSLGGASDIRYIEHKEERISLGKGANVGMQFGINLHPMLALEIGANYTFSERYKVSQHSSSYYRDTNIGYALDDRKIVKNIKADVGNLALSVYFHPNFEKWDPYVKFGIVMNVGQVNKEETSSYTTITSPSDSSVHKIVHSFVLSLGFTGALGINYYINDLCSVFAEWQFTALSSRAIKRKFSTFTQDGVNVLPNYQGDEITDMLMQDLPFPFSSHGLQIGVKFKF